jgi:hypothetical protein
MYPVWHVEQALTWSHTKVIPVNTAAATKSALREVHEDSQNGKTLKQKLLR